MGEPPRPPRCNPSGVIISNFRPGVGDLLRLVTKDVGTGAAVFDIYFIKHRFYLC
jgi:hypothetical protein